LALGTDRAIVVTPGLSQPNLFRAHKAIIALSLALIFVPIDLAQSRSTFACALRELGGKGRMFWFIRLVDAPVNAPLAGPEILRA